MAFQPAPNTAELVLNWSGENDTHWKNVLNIQKTDFTMFDQIDLAEAVATAVTSHGLGLSLADNVTLDTVEVIDIRTQGAPKAVHATTLEGSSPSDMLPPSVCAVLTLRTANRGRSFRGRLYFGGFAEGEMVDSLWIGDVVTRVEAFYDTIKDAVVAEEWTPVVLSRVANGVLRTAAVGTAILAVAVRNNWPGSQRRRIPRR